MGTSYFVHSPPPEREQDTVRLRDGSTQHVRDKQFIFLPQLLTGEKNKPSLGRSTDELFTEMKEMHHGRNVYEASMLGISSLKHSNSEQNKIKGGDGGSRTDRFLKKIALMKKPAGGSKGASRLLHPASLMRGAKPRRVGLKDSDIETDGLLTSKASNGSMRVTSHKL